MKEAERNELRKLVDKAKRSELDQVRRLRKELNNRSAAGVKRATAERKAILAAQPADGSNLEQLAIVARCGPHVYLVSVGKASAYVLDLRGPLPCLSAPEDIYALLAREAQWLPFTDDPEPIVAVARAMIDADGLPR
jgi:hypothetical protein